MYNKNEIANAVRKCSLVACLVLGAGMLVGCGGAGRQATKLTEQAEKAKASGNPQEALRILREAFDKVDQANAEVDRTGRGKKIEIGPFRERLELAAKAYAEGKVVEGDRLLEQLKFDASLEAYRQAVEAAKQGKLDTAPYDAKIPAAYQTQGGRVTQQAQDAARAGNHQEAIRLHEEALALARRGNIPTGPFEAGLSDGYRQSAEALKAQAEALLAADQPLPALEKFDQALAHARLAQADLTAYEAGVKSAAKAGSVQEHTRAKGLLDGGKPVEAIAAYESAVQLAKRAGESIDPLEAGLKKALTAAAEATARQGEELTRNKHHADALRKHESALGYAKRAGLALTTYQDRVRGSAAEAAHERGNEGDTLMKAGRPGAALEAFNDAVAFARRGGLNAAGFQDKANEASDAVQRSTAEEALAQARQKMATDPNGADAELATARDAVGRMHSRASDLHAAIEEVAGQVVENRRRLGREEIQKKINEARAAMEGNPAEADRLLAAARDYLPWTGNDSSWLTAIESAEGDVLQTRKTQALSQARLWLAQASQIAQSDPDEAERLVALARRNIQYAGGDWGLSSSAGQVETAISTERQRRASVQVGTGNGGDPNFNDLPTGTGSGSTGTGSGSTGTGTGSTGTGSGSTGTGTGTGTGSTGTGTGSGSTGTGTGSGSTGTGSGSGSGSGTSSGTGSGTSSGTGTGSSTGTGSGTGTGRGGTGTGTGTGTGR